MSDENKKPCVVVLHCRPFEETTPVMTLLLALKKLGYPLLYVSVESAAARQFLEEYNMPFHLLARDESCYKVTTGLRKWTARLRRGMTFFRHRREVRALLAKLEAEYGEIIVWGQEFSGMALVGNPVLHYRHIVTMFEMFPPHIPLGARVDYKKVMQTATVVLPEPNRAWIYKAWMGLEKLPHVIYNKVEPHPRRRNLPLPPEAQDVFTKIGDRPVFLFQGSWRKDRKDIGMVLETIAKYRSQYCVVTMPATDMARERLAQYDNAFVLPFIPAPGHLAVTSHATVGLAFYSEETENFFKRLNPIYCAPTKVYEYAGFGIPTLGNKLPGLLDTIERAGAGVCCDVTEASILAAADKLIADLENFQQNAVKFFEDTDVEKEIKDVLEAAMSEDAPVRR